jgi:hypothetical protein
MKCSFCTRTFWQGGKGVQRTVQCGQFASYQVSHRVEKVVPAADGNLLLHVHTQKAHGDYSSCPGYSNLHKEFTSWKAAQLNAAKEKPRTRGSQATILARSARGRSSPVLGPALDCTGPDDGQQLPRIGEWYPCIKYVSLWLLQLAPTHSFSFLLREYEQQLLGRSPDWLFSQT